MRIVVTTTINSENPEIDDEVLEVKGKRDFQNLFEDGNVLEAIQTIVTKLETVYHRCIDQGGDELEYDFDVAGSFNEHEREDAQKFISKVLEDIEDTLIAIPVPYTDIPDVP